MPKECAYMERGRASFLTVSQATMDLPRGPSTPQLVLEMDAWINPMILPSKTSLVEDADSGSSGEPSFASKVQVRSCPLVSLGGSPAAELIYFSGCTSVHLLT